MADYVTVEMGGKTITMPKRDFEYLQSWGNLREAPQSVKNLARSYGIDPGKAGYYWDVKTGQVQTKYDVIYSGPSPPPVTETPAPGGYYRDPKTGYGVSTANEEWAKAQGYEKITEPYYVVGGKVVLESELKAEGIKSAVAELPQKSPSMTETLFGKGKAAIDEWKAAAKPGPKFLASGPPKPKGGTMEAFTPVFQPAKKEYPTAIYAPGTGPVMDVMESRQIYESAGTLEKWAIGWHTLFSPSGYELIGSAFPWSEKTTYDVVIGRVGEAKRTEKLEIVGGGEIVSKDSGQYILSSMFDNPVYMGVSTYAGGFGVGQLTKGVPVVGKALGSTAGKVILGGLGAAYMGEMAVTTYSYYAAGERAKATGTALMAPVTLYAGFKGYKAGVKYQMTRTPARYLEFGKTWEVGPDTQATKSVALIKSGGETYSAEVRSVFKAPTAESGLSFGKSGIVIKQQGKPATGILIRSVVKDLGATGEKIKSLSVSELRGTGGKPLLGVGAHITDTIKTPKGTEFFRTFTAGRVSDKRLFGGISFITATAPKEATFIGSKTTTAGKLATQHTASVLGSVTKSIAQSQTKQVLNIAPAVGATLGAVTTAFKQTQTTKQERPPLISVASKKAQTYAVAQTQIIAPAQIGKTATSVRVVQKNIPKIGISTLQPVVPVLATATVGAVAQIPKITPTVATTTKTTVRQAPTFIGPTHIRPPARIAVFRPGGGKKLKLFSPIKMPSKVAYRPSIYAHVFNLTAKVKPARLAGTEYRPIIKGFKVIKVSKKKKK